MLKMKKIEGVPDKSEVKNGMAFFANTGPFGTTCGGCEHRGYYKFLPERFNEKTKQWEAPRRKTNAGEMFKKMSGKHGPVVDAAWPSCKYFAPRASD